MEAEAANVPSQQDGIKSSAAAGPLLGANCGNSGSRSLKNGVAGAGSDIHLALITRVPRTFLSFTSFSTLPLQHQIIRNKCPESFCKGVVLYEDNVPTNKSCVTMVTPLQHWSARSSLVFTRFNSHTSICSLNWKTTLLALVSTPTWHHRCNASVFGGSRQSQPCSWDQCTKALVVKVCWAWRDIKKVLG